MDEKFESVEFMYSCSPHGLRMNAKQVLQREAISHTIPTKLVRKNNGLLH